MTDRQFIDDLVGRDVDYVDVENAAWADIVAILRQMERKAIELAERGVPRSYTTDSYARLQRRFNRLIDELEPRIRDRLAEYALSLSDREAAALVDASEAYDNRDPWITPSRIILASALFDKPYDGGNIDERLGFFGERARNSLVRTLRIAVVERDNAEGFAQRLRDEAFAPIRRYGEIETRSLIQHAIGATRAATYSENGVRRERWLATLDSATCVRCANLHGEEFRAGHGPTVPLHPLCRCDRVPIIDGEEPADMSFEEWLRRRPRAEQIRVLGKARFELWQAGESMDTFTNNKNRRLTLEEIQRL